MARIRTIKPEFPQSESIGRLSRDGRLLFIQLWTIVDDSGRARAASRMLASLLYPYDEDAPKQIGAWLAELECEKLIRRYSVDGSIYLEVCNWLKHQKIDRPTESRLPAFSEGSPITREDSRGLAADLGPSTLDLDLGSRARKRASRLPSSWMPSPSGASFAIEKGLSEKEANAELEKFTNYWTAKSGQGATKLDWDATWRNWILTTMERKGSPNGRHETSGNGSSVLDAIRRQGATVSQSDAGTGGGAVHDRPVRIVS